MLPGMLGQQALARICNPLGKALDSACPSRDRGKTAAVILAHQRARGYPAEQLSQLDEYPLDTPLYQALAKGKA
jgi:hypothetical protein